jgi:hypothetical protein
VGQQPATDVGAAELGAGVRQNESLSLTVTVGPPSSSNVTYPRSGVKGPSRSASDIAKARHRQALRARHMHRLGAEPSSKLDEARHHRLPAGPLNAVTRRVVVGRADGTALQVLRTLRQVHFPVIIRM